MFWWAPFYQYHKKQTPLTGLTLTISAPAHTDLVANVAVYSVFLQLQSLERCFLHLLLQGTIKRTWQCWFTLSQQAVMILVLSTADTRSPHTSCKIWAMALDLSNTWRDSILSNFLSKVSKLLQDEGRETTLVCYVSIHLLRPGVCVSMCVFVCACLTFCRPQTPGSGGEHHWPPAGGS